jgi:hypothetical protein
MDICLQNMFLMLNPFDFEKHWIPMCILKVYMTEPDYIRLNTKKYIIKHIEGGHNEIEFVKIVVWFTVIFYVCKSF